MGRCASYESDEHIREQLRALDVGKYRARNPQLSERDVLEIYRMFLLQRPEHGRVKAAALFKNYSDDPAVGARLRQRAADTLDFDACFEIMGETIAEKRRRFGPNTEFIAEENPPQPLFNCGPSPG